MKFVTYQKDNVESIGIVYESRMISLKSLEKIYAKEGFYPSELIAMITSFDYFRPFLERHLHQVKADRKEEEVTLSREEVRVLAPIPTPRKNIMCVGKNYRDHAIEMGSAADIPADLIVFTKSPSSVVGHLHPVNSHSTITSQLDYEGELAVIIGRKGSNISHNQALDYVFGYTIMNDITARDLQKKHKQFFIGKSLDTFCPMGPVVVTKDEMNHPEELFIKTEVNGHLRQLSNTKHLIFPIQEIISTLSQGMTLEPGDIIATGTPAGVGKGMNPPSYLKNGDKVTVTIEGIGELTNIIE
ncbi:fumarylacetoacetate hydrolase family protein [Bacillus spongiae]|uniref:Fumarylacetoacetate hydrolase family protein n=1 Tax=Bacillus spongiae TaxID=2683610 RepID=A0ABU8HBF2_9BACI